MILFLLDSCKLVAPINRYACGVQFGMDITQSQCESIPYCCFNPIDQLRSVEDDEAQALMDDPLGNCQLDI